MQNKTTEKIIIDKLKLITLQRLGCSERAIIDKVFYDKFTSQNDSLIDTLLESLTDVKSFSNWGGSRENSGRKSSNNNNINQDEKTKLIKSSCVNQVVDKDKEIDKDKIKNNRYGECKNVLLTEEQYKNLSELDNFDLALEKLDTWLGTSGSKNRNKNHYAYFKSNSWVWKDLKPKQTETEETVFIDEHTQIDETMPEFNDMTYDECCRAFEWLQEKMYCQSLSKSKFVEIVRKFKEIK